MHPLDLVDHDGLVRHCLMYEPLDLSFLQYLAIEAEPTDGEQVGARRGQLVLQVVDIVGLEVVGPDELWVLGALADLQGGHHDVLHPVARLGLGTRAALLYLLDQLHVRLLLVLVLCTQRPAEDKLLQWHLAGEEGPHPLLGEGKRPLDVLVQQHLVEQLLHGLPHKGAGVPAHDLQPAVVHFPPGSRLVLYGGVPLLAEQ